MNILKLIGLGKKPKPSDSVPTISNSSDTNAARNLFLRAKFDSALTTEDNRRHWSNADACSADAVANPMVRRILRNRSRYEVSNDTYAKGIISRLSRDVVGTGPKLQIIGQSKAEAARIELKWAAYAAVIKLPEKLRTIRGGGAVSGEVVSVQSTNPKILLPCQIDLRVIEPDHVCSTALQGMSAEAGQYYDGVHYDSFGNPVAYDILRSHPGDTGMYITMPGEYDTIDARHVHHYYKIDRPGQRRGVPETTPSLPLFAYRRRWTLATIAAAETAANHAGVMYTDAPAGSDVITHKEFDFVELERNGLVTLPFGWKLGQLKPEQPISTYDQFNNAIIAEVGQCVDMPFSIAALDSSESNMSAAYNDQSAYTKARMIDRQELEPILNWHFATWYRDMWFAGEFESYEIPDHQWFWPQIGQHADPNKVANSQKIQLASGTTTLVREYAKQGLDAETEIEAGAKSLGVTVPEYLALVRAALFSNGNVLPSTDGTETPPTDTPEKLTTPEPSTATANANANANGGDTVNTEVKADSSLNGAQITAVLDVFARLAKKEVVAPVAIELIVAVGIPRDRATQMVNDQAKAEVPTESAKPNPTQAAPSAQTQPTAG